MATLDKKMRAIACRSSMGVHIQWDDDVQITVTDNDYLDCSSERPVYSGWFSTLEAAADAILEKWKLQWLRYMATIAGRDSANCLRRNGMGEYADQYYRHQVKAEHGFDPGSMYAERKEKPRCPKCGKFKKNEQAVRDHMRDYHGLTYNG